VIVFVLLAAVVLVATIYRARRARPWIGAMTIAIVSLGCIAIIARVARQPAPELASRAGFVAVVGALVAFAWRASRDRGLVAIALVGVTGPGALLLPGTQASAACELAMAAVASYVLGRAARQIAARAVATVADVFA
jgi:hypothetical protein